jgi:hypothetical protein
MLEQRSLEASAGSDELAAPMQGLFDEALTLSRELRVVVRDHLDVFAMEVRQAAWSIAVVLGAAIVLALLIVVAWSRGMDALTLMLLSAGASPAVALLCVAVVNLICAGIAYAIMRAAKRRVGLPATRRLLTPTGEATQLKTG